MCDDFLLIHFIVFCTVDEFPGKQVFQDAPGTFAIDVRHRTGQLDIGALKHFLETIQLPGAFAYKALAVTDQFPQLTLILIRDITWLKQSVLKKVSNPFRILNIGFPARNCFHMAGIDYHGIQVRRFKDVVQRLPIRGSALHGGHLTATSFEPVSQFKEFSGCCTKLTYFLLVAFFEAGYYEFFVYINTTTIVVNFIHNGTSVDEFTARYSVCCHFTVRPSAASGWTDGGANEST